MLLEASLVQRLAREMSSAESLLDQAQTNQAQTNQAQA